MIKPSVGRVVWFTPYADAENYHGDQPMAAIVTYVFGDRMVNLAVFDHNGNSKPYTSVTLVQEGDPRPDGRFAEWMPYQIGQAKKHESNIPTQA